MKKNLLPLLALLPASTRLPWQKPRANKINLGGLLLEGAGAGLMPISNPPPHHHRNP